MSTLVDDIARAIIDDWNGAQYIKDPDVLANFLGEKFRPLTESVTIMHVATLIVDDLRGPGRYKKPTNLAKFLNSKVEPR